MSRASVRFSLSEMTDQLKQEEKNSQLRVCRSSESSLSELTSASLDAL